MKRFLEQYRELLRSLGSPEDLGRLLIAAHESIIPTLGVPRSFLLIDELNRHLETIVEPSYLLPALTGLYSVADRLSEQGFNRHDFLWGSFEDLLSSLAIRISKEVDKDTFFNAVQPVFSSTPSIHCATDSFRLISLYCDPTKRVESEWPVTGVQLDKLKKTIADKLRATSRAGQLKPQHPLVLKTLYGWKAATSSFDEPRAFLKTVIESSGDSDIVVVLETLKTRITTTQGGSVKQPSRTFHRVNKETRSNLLDPVGITELLNERLPIMETEAARSAIRDFLQLLVQKDHTEF